MKRTLNSSIHLFRALAVKEIYSFKISREWSLLKAELLVTLEMQNLIIFVNCNRYNCLFRGQKLLDIHLLVIIEPMLSSSV